ncbi:MAG: DUF1360 domain-containing protein [Rubrobacter sp.]|jgi:hypothetical protein|nr:DUF1360 domain-containing protein [Rubrobacter sp.]
MAQETQSKQEAQSKSNPAARRSNLSTPRDLFIAYDEGEGQPLGAYAGLAGLFSALFAAFLWATRLAGRPVPERVKIGDLALLGVATHKLSWVVANSSVTSFVRAPVTELQEDEDSSNQEEKPRGEGLQKALGKLLTCHFCIGMWVAAFLSYGLVLAPRVTRFFSGILTILAFSDFLHQLYKAAINRA